MYTLLCYDCDIPLSGSRSSASSRSYQYMWRSSFFFFCLATSSFPSAAPHSSEGQDRQLPNQRLSARRCHSRPRTSLLLLLFYLRCLYTPSAFIYMSPVSIPSTISVYAYRTDRWHIYLHTHVYAYEYIRICMPLTYTGVWHAWSESSLCLSLRQKSVWEGGLVGGTTKRTLVHRRSLSSFSSCICTYRGMYLRINIWRPCMYVTARKSCRRSVCMKVLSEET